MEQKHTYTLNRGNLCVLMPQKSRVTNKTKDATQKDPLSSLLFRRLGRLLCSLCPCLWLWLKFWEVVRLLHLRSFRRKCSDKKFLVRSNLVTDLFEHTSTPHPLQHNLHVRFAVQSTDSSFLHNACRWLILSIVDVEHLICSF